MKSEFRANLISRIRDRMRAAGVAKNQEIADAANLSADTFSKLLSEKTDRSQMPTLEQLKRLANALNTSCDYLLGNTQDPSPPSEDSLRLPRVEMETAISEMVSATSRLRDVLAGQEDDELLQRRRARVRREPRRSIAAEVLSDAMQSEREKSNGDGA